MPEMSFDEISSAEDMVLVERLAQEIWPQHYVPLIGMDQVAYMVDRFQSALAIQQQIHDGHRYFLINRDTGPSGYFSVLPDKKNDEVFLSKLYVRFVCRGQGLGRKAVDFVECLARNEGIFRVTLTVNKKNFSSIGFYERCGFLKTGCVVKDIGSGFVMDDWCMEKKISGKDT